MNPKIRENLQNTLCNAPSCTLLFIALNINFPPTFKDSSDRLKDPGNSHTSQTFFSPGVRGGSRGPCYPPREKQTSGIETEDLQGADDTVLGAHERILGRDEDARLRG